MKKAGTVWKISHSRKGNFTVRLLEDCNDEQEWLYVEIVDGVVLMVANNDKGPGDKETLRVSFVRFIEEVPNES